MVIVAAVVNSIVDTHGWSPHYWSGLQNTYFYHDTLSCLGLIQGGRGLEFGILFPPLNQNWSYTFSVAFAHSVMKYNILFFLMTNAHPCVATLPASLGIFWPSSTSAASALHSFWLVSEEVKEICNWKLAELTEFHY